RLIAFSLGAFGGGAAGFGTPVAISAALMMGAGFRPLQAAGLALLANTSPVAFGALGTPILALAEVTYPGGMPREHWQLMLSQMAGRQLPFFSLLVPAWLVWVMAGWRGVVGAWPAVEVPGLHNRIARDRPVVSERKAELAVYKLDWLSATGTSIFLAAVVSAFWLRVRPPRFLYLFGLTLYRMRWPLFTIACMLA